MKRTLLLLLAVRATAQTVPLTGSPLENSWETIDGALYGRIYKTQSNALAGISSTTWIPTGRVTGGGQTNPAYAGVQSIRVSSNWVYVTSSALPTYVMGPWYLDAARTQPFPNWPTNQNKLTRFARVPPGPVATKTKTSLGAIALWVDGGIIHNQLDAFYYNGSYDTNFASVFTQDRKSTRLNSSHRT